MTRIAVDHEKIADFCRRYHVKRLSFFGSVLRDDFGPESDVDMLVEFESDQTPGYFGLAEMEIELADLLKVDRKVDLRTPRELSRYFRDEVVAGAEVVYATA
jgi:predicted nucleotidyltransferase